MKLTPIGSFLKRSKIPVDIEDNKEYKRVTIKIKHNGVSLRDTEIGKTIGTKKQFILNAGQFIVSKIDARYGAFGIAPQSVDGAIITGNFWAYDVDFSQLNIEWFNQYTNSPAFYDLCERASAGITHRKYLNETYFLNYEIQLPSIEEQLIQIDEIKKQKISFGKLTNKLTNQLSLVKQLRQAFLSEAMQGKLCQSEPSEGQETGQQLLTRIKAEKAQLIKDKKLKKDKELPPIKTEEIPFDIPKDWVWARGTDVAQYIDPQPSHRTPTVSKDGVPYIAMSDIRKDGTLDFNSARKVSFGVLEEHKNRYKLVNGDFIFGKIGTIGKPVILPEPFEYTLSANVIVIQPNRNIIADRYLFYFLSSPIAEKNLIDKKSTTSYPVFGMGKARDMLIPLPPLSIQNQIVAKLDELMKTCDDLENSIKQSQIQNEQLLQQVLKEALEIKEDVEI
jgi:type I restriction enzyme S subunit